MDVIAGLSIPLIRLTTNKPADIKAPVFPAETMASASTSATALTALTKEESFFFLTDRTGSSSDSIFSVTSMNVTLG